MTSTRLQLNHKLDVLVRWHTWQLRVKDIDKFFDHWHLRPLTSIQLVHLHTIGNTLSSDHRLYDKFHFLSIRGCQLDGLIGTVDQCLVLTRLGHSKNDVNAIRLQDYKVDDKVYPLYFRIHLWA
jgi:hypothetical protein